MVCTTCNEHSSYANKAQTIQCQICGQIIEVPTGVKEFVCPYCNSIYEITAPTLADNGWLLPFAVGFILSAFIFTGVGRSMVKTLSDATLTELQTAAARRKAKLGG